MPMLLSCASPGIKRIFLDSSVHSDSPPDWVESTKISWEKDGKVYIKVTHQIRGDQRVNGCLDLAKMDGKENILSEIANDVKGFIDNAQQSINEQAEIILEKARNGEFEGRIIGLRFIEQYWERYSIGEIERVDCHVLAEMKLKDYNATKQSVINKLVGVDQRLRENITKKQINFFKNNAQQPVN